MHCSGREMNFCEPRKITIQQNVGCVEVVATPQVQEPSAENAFSPITQQKVTVFLETFC